MLSALAFSAGADTGAKRQNDRAANPPEKTHPVFEFKNESRGAEAYKRIVNAGKAKEFAQFYDIPEAELPNVFKGKQGEMARLDKKGRLFFVDSTEGAVAGDSGATVFETAVDPNKTFFLNSKPDSSKTIYLDFTGHVATGTAWNSSYGIDPINSPAFDTDGSPSTFSASEHSVIQGVWRRVAEDYAAFDVNVTTQEPPADRLVRSASTDAIYGTRVVITKDFTKSTASPCGCGGFAYVGVFNSTSELYKPAYVFQDNLGNNEKNIAEATTHEAGHNLGLGHDGTSTTGYYQGHGTGETGWAPIMGVGYSKNLVQWSKGEYANANNTQDDYLVMQGKGLVFDADEAGNTPGTAKALSATVVNGLNSYSTKAILQGPLDVDFFAISSAIGNVSISTSLAPTSPNSDLVVSLVDAQGNVLAQSSPENTLNAPLSFSVPAAGTYYISVQPSGRSAVSGTADQGYPRYGSAGNYGLSITAPISTANQAPVAVATADKLTGTAPLVVNFTGSGSYDPDGSITAFAWDLGNGSTATTANTSTTYTASGLFTASLTVTDAKGATASKSIQIDVKQPVATVPMSVASITMSNLSTKGAKRAGARVRVLDNTGKPVPNASVSGAWSGIVTGSATVTTDSQGFASFTSPNAKKSGTYVFTVRAVRSTGYVYDANGNAMTSNSITF